MFCGSMEKRYQKQGQVRSREEEIRALESSTQRPHVTGKSRSRSFAVGLSR